MSVRMVGETRLGRRAVVGLVLVLVVTLVGGYLGGGLARDVPQVLASGTHPANSACPGSDVTVTSSIEVTHQTGPGYLGSATVVEPDDSQDWTIDAYWYPAANPPGETKQTATATVTWNGSSWVLSNVTLPADINAIGICQGDSCDAGGGSVHSWSYKLIVDLNDPIAGANPNLDHVTYTTSSVDDGYTVEDPTRTQGDCYLGTAVQPTSQSFAATDYQADWGTGRCGYSCDSGGTSVTLTYD